MNWNRTAALLSGLAMFVAGQGAAATQAAPTTDKTITLTGDEALSVALQVMLANGQTAEALQLIQSLPAERRAQADMALVEAQLLRLAGDHRRATDVYRRLLSRYPKDQRVRLELAETLFQIKDLRASEHFFRLALSGDLPAQDRRLARVYLNQVLAMRPWTVTGSFGLAPDSNVNNATSARQIELWGLPFELSDEARKRSGVSVNAQLQGEGSIKLAPGARLVGSLWGQVSESRLREVSSEGVGLRAGPEFAARDHRWSVAALGERRWYGGTGLYRSAGAGLNGDLGLDGGLSVYSGGLSALRLNYDSLDRRDGWLYGLDLQRTRYVSPQMFWRAGITLRANRAREDTESYDSVRLSTGVYRSLPLRLGLFVEPSVMVSRYRQRDDLFGVVREDREWSVAGRLVKEDYTFWGFAPYLGGQVTRSESTIRLYSFDRTRLDVGVTRTF